MYDLLVPPSRRKDPLSRPPGGGAPKNGAPKSRLRRPPKERAVGKPPNPRMPAKVRDVHGGVLKDLFQLFPDLPRPPRPGRRRKPVPRTRRLG